ncbi:hypothetical protein ACJX0J_014932, partial [Zea mays]
LAAAATPTSKLQILYKKPAASAAARERQLNAGLCEWLGSCIGLGLVRLTHVCFYIWTRIHTSTGTEQVEQTTIQHNRASS